MPDNRLTLTIEAQNLAQAAFRQLQADVRRSNEALQKTGQVGQRVGAGIKVLRDELGRAAQATLQAGRNVARLTDQFVGLYRSSGAVRQLGRDFRFLQNNIQATSGIVQQFTRNLTAQTQAIVEQAARVERLKLGLETLSPSIQEAEKQYRDLIEVARLPGIDFSNALQANLQLQAIGKSGEEATRILKAFGNALALSGASTADIQRVIYGLRQLIADGVVLQRELNIVTARVPTAVPIIQERFGSIRAEGIREHFDNLGVAPSDQASEFIKILTAELEKLPSAADTASNAIENLGDTFRRAQASVGEGLLPVVKETIAAIEGLLFSVEKDEGLKTAIADWLAFATAMGTVTAGVVGVAAVIPLLGGLANPIGLTALAVGALAGAFVKAEVAAARLRAEYSRTQEALRAGLRVGRGEDTDAIGKEIARLEARRTFLQNRIASLREEAEAARSPTAALATTHLQDESLRVSTERQTEAILEQNDAYKTYQSQLFQVDKTIEVLTRRTDKLNESQQDAADTATDTLTRAFKSLTDAASGTDAQIATALQQFENASGSANEAVRDLALDIGDQLVAIAESTTESQTRSAYKRVESYARDNSLIIAEDENLKALLLAAENAFQRKLFEIVQKAQRERLATDKDRLIRDSAAGIRDALAVLNNTDASAGQLRGAQQELNEFADVLNRLGGIVPNLEAFNDQFRILIQLRSHDEETGQRLQAIGREISATQKALQNEAQIRRNLSEQAADDAEQAADRQIAIVRQTARESEAAASRVESRNADRRRAEARDNAAALRERTRAVEEATQEITRLEERALDASSQSQRENLIRDTAQFIDAYAERGEAFHSLVQDAQDLGVQLQEAFDLTEQQKRIEEFQDSLAGMIENLAGIAIDHIWDSFTDGASRATDAVATFTDEVRGQLQLLQSDITRLTRFDEDQDIRRERLIEDRDRRLAQLQRQRQALAARAPVGDQRGIERNFQRQQDISARISALREDFGVRLSRFDEDRERRRDRTIEDALQRRERFESRGSDESLISKLVGSLTNSLSNTLSSTISSAIASALGGALGGQFTGLVDAIKGLFGSGGETQTTTTTPATQGTETTTPALEGDADVDGTIKTLTVDPALATPNIDVAGMIKSAVQATDGYTIPSIEVAGAIKSAVVDASYVPITVNVKGLVTSVMLAPDLVLPTVHLQGVVNQLSVDPAAIIPTVDTGATIKSLTVDAAVPSPQVDADGTVKSLSLSADAEVPDITTTGRMTSLVTDPAVVVPDVEMQGKINELTKGFTEPIDVKAKADVELNLPDTDLLPPIDLGGLRFTNAPNVPITFTPEVETPDTTEPAPQKEGGRSEANREERRGSSTETSPPTTPRPNDDGVNQIALFEDRDRRSQLSRQARGANQTNITPEQLTKALIEGQRESQEVTRSALHDLPRTIVDGIGRLGSFILGSGLIGVGAGDAAGDTASDQVNADVAATLRPEGSPRSDFVVTLSPNVYTNQGTRDPDDTGDDDDETARGPAAVQFGDTGSALNAAANLLSLDALANIAQEDTLVSLGEKLDAVRLGIDRIADQPIVSQLRDAGVLLPQTLEERTNSFLPDVLTQGGINQLANQENVDRNLALMQDLGANAQPANLAAIPGSSEGNPMYMHMVNQREVQDVRLVGGKIESVGSVGEIRKQVNVKHVGSLAVTQDGEFVVQIAGGGTLPVRVDGGRMTVDIGGGLEGLAVQLADTETGLEAVGAI